MGVKACYSQGHQRSVSCATSAKEGTQRDAAHHAHSPLRGALHSAEELQ